MILSYNALHIPILVIVWLWNSSGWAKTAPETEIHVTLLGQPCLLQGPFDESTLRAIHAIGPAQIYPTLSPVESHKSKDEARRALEKIRNNTSLPSLLDRYRERLGRRLEAQIAFLEGFDSYKRSHKLAALLKAGKRYLQERDLKSFENLLKKLDGPNKNPAQIREGIDQLFDTYNDQIEHDPEEEFHRAIKKMNVEYTCSFEESEEIGE